MYIIKSSNINFQFSLSDIRRQKVGRVKSIYILYIYIYFELYKEENR